MEPTADHTYSGSGICRTCLLDSKNMQSLNKYTEIADRTEKLSVFLNELTNLEFVQDDGLPGYICQECVQQILSAISFIDMCLRAEDVLRGKSVINFEQVFVEKDEDTEQMYLSSEEDAPNLEKDAAENVEAMEEEEIPNEINERIQGNSQQLSNDSFRPYDCNFCGKYLFTNSSYRVHLLTVHGKDNENLNCIKCDRTFTNSQKYQRHLQTHEPGERVNCEVCGKNLKKDTMRGHMLIHGPRTFLCAICGNSFTQKINLTKHLITHQTEKPIKCEICQKDFKMKDHLRNHMIYHSEKRFPCNECSYSFRTKYELKEHMRVHTGERPYACKFCDKKFACCTTLKTHTYQHMYEKPYNCKICDKGFIQKHCFTNHMVKQHPNEPFEIPTKK